jgi:hypothetical protein
VRRTRPEPTELVTIAPDRRLRRLRAEQTSRTGEDEQGEQDQPGAAPVAGPDHPPETILLNRRTVGEAQGRMPSPGQPAAMKGTQ